MNFPITKWLRKTSIKKAEILNIQFQLVFTHDDSNQISEMDGPEYPQINNLIIHFNRVKKLLKKMNVNKTSGSDDLTAYITKEIGDKTGQQQYRHNYKIVYSLKTGLKQM